MSVAFTLSGAVAGQQLWDVVFIYVMSARVKEAQASLIMTPIKFHRSLLQMFHEIPDRMQGYLRI
eukprot:8965164-Pyramimonas_sp.AAC.1